MQPPEPEPGIAGAGDAEGDQPRPKYANTWIMKTESWETEQTLSRGKWDANKSIPACEENCVIRREKSFGLGIKISATFNLFLSANVDY